MMNTVHESIGQNSQYIHMLIERHYSYNKAGLTRGKRLNLKENKITIEDTDSICVMR